MEAVTQEDGHKTRAICMCRSVVCFTEQSRGQCLSLDGQESGKAAHALPVQKAHLPSP